MADHSIKGKVVLIAGGAKNLGGLISPRSSQPKACQGYCSIHYNSAASQAQADATVDAIRSAGAEAVAFQADLTLRQRWSRNIFADVVAAVGKPDLSPSTPSARVLKKPFAEISEAEYDEMTAVNSKAAFFFLKEAGKHVNDNGKIVTLVTSLLGAFTPPVLCRVRGHQGSCRALHARGRKGIWHARHFGHGSRPRTDGHAVFLSGRRRRRGRVP